MKVIRGVAGRVGRRKQLAIIVDGPNILRRELGLDLEEIRKISESMGRVRRAVVVLNRQAPEKLVEAVANAGFDVKISFGKPEVDFTIEAMEAAFTDKIQTLILATRSAAYLPIIHKIKEIGKEVVVIGAEPGFSVALKKAADLSLSLGEGSAKSADTGEQGKNNSRKTKGHKGAKDKG
ncbi:MAG: NYN domain-containing protein [Thermoproteota archaeon]|mgnify:CR=1 FL=1|nr:MAG: NYN domain-containing protein [Candidatus Korarchaeota archaeon]